MTDVQISPTETQPAHSEIHAGCEQSEKLGVALCGTSLEHMKPQNVDSPTCSVCEDLITSGKSGFVGQPPYPCNYNRKINCTCWVIQ